MYVYIRVCVCITLKLSHCLSIFPPLFVVVVVVVIVVCVLWSLFSFNFLKSLSHYLPFACTCVRGNRCLSWCFIVVDIITIHLNDTFCWYTVLVPATLCKSLLQCTTPLYNLHHSRTIGVFWDRYKWKSLLMIKCSPLYALTSLFVPISFLIH